MWITVLVCLGCTILGAMSGIGGGVIIKPLLDAVLPLGMEKVSLISSFAVFSMALFSIAQNCLGRGGRKELDIRYALPLALGSMVGGVFGKTVFSAIAKLFAEGDGIVKLLQNLALLLLMLFILLFKNRQIYDEGEQNPFAGIPIGTLLGLSAAFLGIGGGPFNMLVLTAYYRMPYKKAAIYSLFVILFSQGAAIVTAALGNAALFDARYLLAAAIAGICGGMVGRRLAVRLSDKAVRALYCGALVFIVTLCLFNILSEAI